MLKMEITLIAFSIISLIVGLFLGWSLFNLKKRKGEEAIMNLRSENQACEKFLEELRRQVAEREEAARSLATELTIAQQEKAVANTRLGEAMKNAEEQKRLLERAEEKLSTTFQALSGESLKSNNKAFIELAQKTLEAVLNKAKGEFGEKEESVKNIVGSLGEALKRYEDQIKELEGKRAADYGSLETQITYLVTASQSLRKETGNLVTALRRPEVRGRWGEVTLKRVVELAGMSVHCDFTEQVSVDTDQGKVRPDMIVHLPAGREIVVDSKVSLDAYMDGLSAEEEKKKAFFIKHAHQVRRHMKTLSGKGYWEQFEKAPEFLVMFIPGESFLSVALEADHNLIEDGLESKVIIATPTTLIALLRAIAFGWRQEQITEHAQEIAGLGKEIYDRFQPFLHHVGKTGDCLSQATVSYNKMLMSLERRVMVSVRKFKELGVAGDKELPELQPIEQIPMKSQESQKPEDI